jgi:hypothetical protein
MYNWRFQPVRVRRDCDGEWVNENVAGTFVNIESDFEGRDKLTYKCAKCGENHTSLRYG